MIKLGSVFYDEYNDRYITVDGVGCDPKCYSCFVEERQDDGEYKIVDRQLFMLNELIHLKEV